MCEEQIAGERLILGEQWTSGGGGGGQGAAASPSLLGFSGHGEVVDFLICLLEGV